MWLLLTTPATRPVMLPASQSVQFITNFRGGLESFSSAFWRTAQFTSTSIESELIPFTTTASSYVPAPRSQGTVKFVEIISSPVATPIHECPNVRQYETALDPFRRRDTMG